MKLANKVFYRMILLLAAIQIMCSCKDELDNAYPGGGPSQPGKDITLQFNVSDAAMPGARGDGTDFEDSYLSDLWMLVFRTDPKNPDDHELRYYMARKVEAVKKTGDPSQANATVTLPSDIFLDDFKMVFLANSSRLWDRKESEGGVVVNSPDDLFLEAPGTEKPYDRGKTLKQCRDRMVLALDENAMKQGKGLYHQFVSEGLNMPMYGEMDWKGREDYPSTPLLIGETKLLRSVARLDVGVNYQGGGQNLSDKANGFDHFRISNIFVGKTNSDISVTPFSVELVENEGEISPEAYAAYVSSKDANPWVVKKVSVPNPTTVINEWIKAYVDSEGVTDKQNSHSIEQRMFLPEQALAAVAGATQDEASAKPYVIVEGYYGEDNVKKYIAGQEAVKSYYKLEFVRNSQMKDYFDIKRGNLIRMNISKVSGPGFPTPEEAASSTAQNITVDISMYELANRDIAFDGQSYLSVERLYVDMPRDKDISFKLLTDFGGDIKWEDIQLGHVSEDGSEVFNTTPSDEIILGDVFSAKKEKSGEEQGDLKYWIRITTRQNYNSSSANQQKLLIKGKNLKLTIDLEQKDISSADWELGKSEDLILEGDLISSNVLYFEGAGNEQNLTVSTTDSGASLTFFDNEDFSKPLTGEWLSITKKTSTGSNTSFTINALPNLSDEIRTAYGKLVANIAGSHKTFTITINQGQLTNSDIVSVGYGVKWLDRNAGAKNQSIEEQKKSNLYEDAQSAALACPYGWGLPEKSDFDNLVKAMPNNTSLFDSKIGFTLVEEDVLMMYGTYEKAYLPEGEYWLYDGNRVKISAQGTPGQLLKPSLITIESVFVPESSRQSANQKYYARCIRKFRLNQSEVKLDMTGKEQLVNFMVLNPTDEVKEIEITGTDKDKYGITCERVGRTNSFRVYAATANWTDNDLNYAVKIKMNDGSENTKNSQTLNLTFGKKLPASTANSRVTIGNLEWDFRNLGVEGSPTEESLSATYLMKKDEYKNYSGSAAGQPGRRKYLYWEGREIDVMHDIQGSGQRPENNEVYKQYFGTPISAENKDICKNRMGDGWRLPTLVEWIDLFENHLQVYKKPWKPSNEIIYNIPDHNKEYYPIYYITDGKTMTFFNPGLSYSTYTEEGLNNGFGYYLTSDLSGGTSTYMVGFNRYLYNPDNGEQFKFYTDKIVPTANFEPQSIIISTTSGSGFHSVRCVRVVDNK